MDFSKLITGVYSCKDEYVQKFELYFSKLYYRQGVAVCLLRSFMYLAIIINICIGRRKNSTTSYILKLNLCCNKFTRAKLTII